VIDIIIFRYVTSTIQNNQPKRGMCGEDAINRGKATENNQTAQLWCTPILGKNS
jgi:hypothetical protein